MNWDSVIPPDLALQLQDTVISVVGGIILVLVAGLIAFVGWLLATFIGRAAQFLLAHMGVDASSERLAPGQIRRPELYPSRLVGYALFWTMFLSAIIVALRVVGLDLAPSIAQRLQDVVPRVLTSAVVLILGIPLALAGSRVVNALLAPSGLRPNRIRSQAVAALLIGFVVLVALEQLGLAAQLVMAIGITVVAAAGLALALAFGIGCRDLARDLIVEYLRASDEGTHPRRP
jgi:hypothetical protein